MGKKLQTFIWIWLPVKPINFALNEVTQIALNGISSNLGLL